MEYSKNQMAKVRSKSHGFPLSRTPFKKGDQVKIWSVDKLREFYVVRDKDQKYWYFSRFDLEAPRV